MWNERRWARKSPMKAYSEIQTGRKPRMWVIRKSREGRRQCLLNDYYKPGTGLRASHTPSHLTLPATLRKRYQKLTNDEVNLKGPDLLKFTQPASGRSAQI